MTDQQREWIYLLIFPVLVVLSFLFGSWRGSAPTLQTVTLKPPTAVLTVGETLQLQATGQDNHGKALANPPVTWSVEGESVRVDAHGLVTAVQLGGATVIARTGAVQGTSRISVEKAPPVRLVLNAEQTDTLVGAAVPVTAQVLDTRGKGLEGIPVQFTAALAGAEPTSITEVSDATGVARAVLPPSSQPGTAEVQATAEGLPPERLAVTSHAATMLQVTPPTATVAIQGSQTFRAVAADVSGRMAEVVPAWQVSGTTGGITEQGVFTATSLGSDTIVATHAGLTARAQLNVVPGEVATLQVTPTEATVVAGTTQQFQVAALTAQQYRLDVAPAWEVIPATLGTVDPGSVFTARSVGTGEAAVTVQGQTVRVPLTVTPGALVALLPTPDRVQLRAGEEMQLEVSGRDPAGNVLEITPYWSLTAPLGDLTSAGVLQARRSGTAQVRVTAGHPAVVTEIPLQVGPAALQRLEVHPGILTLVAGTRQVFTALGYDAFGNPVAVSPVWRLSAEMGQLDERGAFEAQRAGVVEVHAEAGEVKGQAQVLITAGPLAALTIQPAGPLTLAAGTTVPLTVSGYDAYSNPATLTPTWSQSPTLGPVDAQGAFRAERVGAGALTVQSGEQQATVQVTVTPGPLAKVVVSPTDAVVRAGQVQAFQATGFDAYNNEVPVQPTWQATENIGDVSAAGHLTAGQARAGQVVATVETISSSTTVTVQPGALARLQVAPEQLTLTAGDTATLAVTGYDAFDNVLPVQPAWQVPEGLGAVTPEGVFTAQKAGSGRLGITAGTIKADVPVQVTRGEVVALQMATPAVRLASGQQHQFSVEGLDRGGNSVPVEARWEVQGPVGTIAADGRFTATLVGPGAIRATAGTLTAEASVDVVPGEVTTLRLEPEKATLVAGESLIVKSEAFDAAGNRVSASPAWSLEGPPGVPVGTVSQAGVFTARRVGPGQLIATLGQARQTVAVQVDHGPLAAIEVLPAMVTLKAGEKHPFSAAGFDAHGNAVPIEPTWSVQGNIGRVDAQGVLTATATGSGAVIAVVGPVAGLASVTVQPATAWWRPGDPARHARGALLQ